jgi:hypothetical protein
MGRCNHSHLDLDCPGASHALEFLLLFCVICFTSLSERVRILDLGHRAWLHPELFGFKPELESGSASGSNEEGRPSIEMAARGRTSVG